MGDLKYLLEESILLMRQTTELFYQQKTDEGYQQLDSTLAVLTETMGRIFKYKEEGHDILIDEHQLVQVLTEAMKAMEEKDTVLLSDILQYELEELLNLVLSVL